MEKKTASDLRTFLSGFEPEYPLKKGYISHLFMNERLRLPSVYKKIKEIVQIAEPDKQMHENRVKSKIYNLKKILEFKKSSISTYWTDLVNLNQESFSISFDTQLMDMQQNTPETPVDMVESIPAHNDSVSVPVLFRSPSPKRLNRDCDNCVRKNRTIASMQKKNKSVQEHVTALKKKLKDLRLKTLNEKIRRKPKSADIWRARHPGLTTELTDMQKKLYATDRCLKTCMEENRTLKTSSKELTHDLKNSHKKIAGLIVHNVKDKEEFATKPYLITFKKLCVTPASSQPKSTSSLSPSRHPELAPTSEMLLQPDIPVTTLMQPICNSTISSSFFSATCKLPSPRKLKRDCANCVTKQCAIMNMLQRNKRLHHQLREFKILFMEENGNFSMNRFNENIKIQTQSVTQWKTKYYTLMKACRVRSTQKLFQMVHNLEQKVKTLEGATISAQEKNSNMASVKVRLESMIETTDNFNANLKQENEQLKNMLGNTETANANFKQHGHLRSILDETENDDAHLKCYRQASHSPETEVKEELPFDAADNDGGNFALENEEIRQEHIYEATQNTVKNLSVLAEVIRLDHDYDGQLEVKQKAANVKDVEILSTESMDGDTCSTQDVRSGGDENKQTQLQSDQPPVLHSGHPPVFQSDLPLILHSDQPPVLQSDLPPVLQSDLPPVLQSDQPPVLHSDQPPVLQSHQPPVLQSHQPPVLQSHQPPVLQSDQPLVLQSNLPPVLQSNLQLVLQSDQPPLLQSDQPSVLQFYRCDFCNRGFRHLSSLQEHRFVHTGERPFKCSLCGFRCRLYQYLKSHTLLMHPGENLYKNTQCDLCGSVFNNRRCLQRHMLKHAGCYQCDVCGREFKYNHILQCHMRIHTGEKPYKCHVCGFECAWKKTLDLHILRHTEERPFQCDVCGLTFRQSQTLKSHTKGHIGKPCKCDVCGLEFLHNTDMKKHKKLHSKEKNYVCSVCGYRYKTMSCLKLHMRKHTGEKPYQCDICYKSFVQKGNLKSHIRIHTHREKPYQCDVCDKSFSVNSSLKSHKRIHTGERPYKCDVCGFAFKQSSSLNTHTIIHTGEKPYMCDICGFQVNRKGNLRLHKKIHRT